jgi:hypothetical protein
VAMMASSRPNGSAEYPVHPERPVSSCTTPEEGSRSKSASVVVASSLRGSEFEQGVALSFGEVLLWGVIDA